MRVGLRIDVDTYRGTRYGVPNLCTLFASYGIKASLFFSVGPDNMGRHLWRLVHPSFLWKMLRTRAASLYGWDIILRGTFWPGPVIGEKLSAIINDAAQDAHEVGLHAWDHHAWQTHITRMDGVAIGRHLLRAVQTLRRILGDRPICSAVPAWKCTDTVLTEKEKFPFQYNSDCRGESIFYPVVDGVALLQPQIPVTLPTYDELVGQHGISDRNYNEHMLSLFREDALNVLTIHAEVEGIARRATFERFIKLAKARGVSFVPLGSLLESSQPIAHATMIAEQIPGRQGWVSRQRPLRPTTEMGAT